MTALSIRDRTENLIVEALGEIEQQRSRDRVENIIAERLVAEQRRVASFGP